MCAACNSHVFDVLVVGAGIAGCEAALAAAASGASVGLASAGATFSGSSFFPGTWGLGLVGPTGSFAGFSVLSKIVLCLDMLFGRLELYPMLVLLFPSTWRRK